MKKLVPTKVALSLCLLAAPASAQEVCSLYEEVSNTQLLRRLSLDLRQQLPNIDEYEALGDEPVGDDTIDAYIDGPDFAAFVQRFHEDMLWSNVANVRIASNDGELRYRTIVGSGGVDVYVTASNGRSNVYRGGAETCANFEQTEYCTAVDQANGCPFVGVPKRNAQGQDGWVEVTPYWDPSSTVRVCAGEAQTAEYWQESGTVPANPNPLFDHCNFIGNASREGCGCGPNLRWCFGPNTEREVREEIRQQMMRLIEDHTLGGEPYSEMLTTKKTYMNGRLYQWKTYLAQMTSPAQSFNFWMPGDVAKQTSIDYNDLDWKAEVRDSPYHSGILTLPAYTLRFQTNRGRANRFRNVFQGQFYEPPSSDKQPGCIEDTDDLTVRCTCMACHTHLEQASAYFGNISQAGSALLDNRTVFPEKITCSGGDPLCNLFYINDADATGYGHLAGLQFWNDTAVGQAIYDNFQAGPSKLAQEVIDDRTFARTMVLNLWRHLMRRDMDLSPLSEDNEADLLAELADELYEGDQFKPIVKRLVKLEQYRRMR